MPQRPDWTPGSQGTPQLWYETVIAAKQGIATNVAVVALTGSDTPLTDDEQEMLYGSACLEPTTPRLNEWVDLFGEQGFQDSVCGGDYAPFFANAVTVIDDACDDFQPIE